MDQDAFRKTYREVNEVYCAFEKSVLTNECQCSQAERFCIAEREGVHCRSEERQARCLKWLELLREQARFALRTEEQTKTAPSRQGNPSAGRRHARADKDPGPRCICTARKIDDVDGMLAEAEKLFDALENAPFSEIMREVAAYKVRKRSRRRR